eukprot:1161319-Pelagomonas_calceolata.AAC.17
MDGWVEEAQEDGRGHAMRTCSSDVLLKLAWGFAAWPPPSDAFLAAKGVRGQWVLLLGWKLGSGPSTMVGSPIHARSMASMTWSFG